MIAAMTATAVLYAMPAGFAAEAQMQNVLAMEASAQTTPPRSDGTARRADSTCTQRDAARRTADLKTVCRCPRGQEVGRSRPLGQSRHPCGV